MVGDPSAITATARSQEKPMLSDLQTGSAAGRSCTCHCGFLWRLCRYSCTQFAPQARLTCVRYVYYLAFEWKDDYLMYVHEAPHDQA